MAKKIKAAFFDVDGTLVGFRHHCLSQTDRESLDAMRANGVKIYLATGRHRNAIDKITYPVDGVVTMNGALSYAVIDGPAPVQDKDAFKVIGRNPFPDELIRKVAQIIEDNGFSSLVDTEKDCVINMYNDIVDDGFRVLEFPRLPLKPLMEAIKEPVYELTVFIRPEQEAEYFGPYLDDLEFGRWSDKFTDFDYRGSTKALGIDHVVDYLGISLEETISFGDGGNDIPMLRHAGIGVAMDNSSDKVKASADFVTLDVEENGVTYALKHFGII